jgi:hypothetical protein
MIHVFFVPGMFGSMVEMVLRSFTDLDGTLKPKISDDGSAHSFRKQHHCTNSWSIGIIDGTVSISTPIYPFKDLKLPEILLEYTQQIPTWFEDKKILIYAHDMKWAEINMLFQYHKIAIGLNRTLEIFGGNVNQHHVSRWNAQYTSWKDMAQWEYREWLSLFYPVYVQEWIVSKNQVSDDFMVLSSQKLLECPKECLYEIIDFCELNLLTSPDSFLDEYRQKQQYVLHEYELIENIVRTVLNGQKFSWDQLSIIGEAILQHHFRTQDYEWYCDGLDILPTNSIDFADILYKPTKEMHA